MTVAAVQRIAKASTAGTSTIDSGTGWATPTAGNLIVVTANSDATVTMTSSGYTAGPSVVDNNAVYAWYKVAAGTETSVVVTLGASTEIVHTACEYSGLTASPFDVSNTSTIPNTDGTSTTSVSVTTTVDGDLVIALAGLADFSGSGANPTSPSWTNSFTNQLTSVSTGALGVRCNSFYAELIAGTAGAVSTSASWTNSAFKRQELVLAFKAAAATTIPWSPPRLAQTRDYGEVPWTQRDRRDANLVAAAANDLAVPLLAEEARRQATVAATHYDRRVLAGPAPWAQRDPRNANLVGAGANDLSPPLLAPAGAAQWHLYSDAAARDRRLYPQQRAYFDPALLVQAVTQVTPSPARTVPPRDYGETQWQQRAGRDPTLLTTALLENELLGGAGTPQRANIPATHAPRWWAPRQPKRDATAPGLLDSAQLENELLGGADSSRHRMWHADRRVSPQQRTYFDVSLLATALLEDGLLGVGLGRPYVAAATHTARRWSPQQQLRRSIEGLLDDALLEGPILGEADVARHRTLYRAEPRAPQPPRTFNPSLVAGDIDPLTVAWAAGGGYWHRYNTLPVRALTRAWRTIITVLLPAGAPLPTGPDLDILAGRPESPWMVGPPEPTWLLGPPASAWTVAKHE
jgi:hypothetical protein